MPRAQKDATVTAVTAPALPPAVLARVAEFLLRRKRQLLKFILLSKVHYRAGLPVLLRHLDLRFARDPRGGKEMLAAFLKDGLRTDKFRHVRSIDTGMQEFRGYAGVPSAQLSRLLSKCSQLRSLKTAAKSRAQLPALANALAGSHPSLVELDLDLQTSAAEALEFCGPLPRRPWIIRIHTVGRLSFWSTFASTSPSWSWPTSAPGRLGSPSCTYWTTSAGSRIPWPGNPRSASCARCARTLWCSASWTKPASRCTNSPSTSSSRSPRMTMAPVCFPRSASFRPRRKPCTSAGCRAGSSRASRTSRTLSRGSSYAPRAEPWIRRRCRHSVPH